MNIKNHIFWVIAVIGVLLDQVTKYWIVQALGQIGNTVPVIEGFFHLTYVTNEGAALSLMSDGGAFWLRWFSLIISLAIIGYALFGSRMDRWSQIGFGCILAGAIGNGIDRFRLGEVIDFLSVNLILFWFPTFNVADAFISIGVVCLLIAAFRQPSNGSKRPRSNGNSQ